MLLHVVLCVEELLTDLCQEDVTFCELHVQSCDARDARLVGRHGRRWPPVDLERRSLQCCLVGRVVAKLYPWQPLKPAPGTVSCQAAQVYSKDSICYLRLAISLRVDDREYDGVASDIWKSLDEIHGDVLPNCRQHWKRLEKTSRMKVLGLVALARRAAENKVADHPVGVRGVERRAEAVERLLDALVPDAMGRRQDLWPERGRRRHEDAALV